MLEENEGRYEDLGETRLTSARSTRDEPLKELRASFLSFVSSWFLLCECYVTPVLA
jgi:hypothetical protein